MKIKKQILILSFLIVFLLSLTYVSAADHNNESVIELTNLNDNTVDNGITQTNEIYGSSSKGSFEDLQKEFDNAPAGSVLYLTRDYEDCNEICYLNKDLTVDGQGHIIDGTSDDCTPFYSSSGKITLRNINIINCENDDNYKGGAIHIAGSAQYTIENCIFTNNWADDWGGAIYHGSTSPLKIINCQFNNNKADDDGGGAIYSNGDIYIQNTIFNGNIGDNNGGAIYKEGTQTLRIENCQFNNNKADDDDAGAIYTTSETTIINSTFQDNTANDNGGAIYSTANLIIKDSNFTNNKADDSEIYILTYGGGAIYSSGDLYIQNSIFNGNIGDNNGGAIYKEGTQTLRIENCQFNNNKADDDDAGAIYTTSETTIINSTFQDNTANDNGGAIYAQSETTILNSAFEGNFADDVGGAIYSEANLIIKDSTFTNNKVDRYVGGAIYTKTTIKIYDSKFEDNSAKELGGAIYSSGNIIINMFDQYSSRSFFINNKAENGGAIYSCELLVSDGVFNNNVASIDGGAIFCNNNSMMRDCSFESNSAGRDGGAIFCNNNSELRNCSFESNSFGRDGGAMCCMNNLEVTDCLFESNHANLNNDIGEGGAIYCKHELTLQSSEFKNNRGDDGGAIYTGTTKFISNCIFINNTAKINSGAIYIYNDCTPKFYKCHFEKNSCNGLMQGYGGAIYLDTRSSSEISIEQCTFIDNFAKSKGGAIYACSIKDTTDSIFINNKAEDNDGGAIYIDDECTPKFYKCYFEKNSCGDEGGAIYIDSSSSKTSIEHCSFIDNKASKDNGQSVYNCGNYTTVNRCWHGTNTPDFTDQFKIWHQVSSDEDYTPSEYAVIGMKLNETTFYKGNPYEVSVYFYLNTNPDEIISDIPFNELIYTGDGEFSNPDNHHELTKNVIFTKNNATIYATLNYQTLNLNVNAKNKTPTYINIKSCESIVYLEKLEVIYEISINNNATYKIKDSNGTIIINGNITDPHKLSIEGLDAGQYTLTINNPETWHYLPSNTTANFTVYKKQAIATVTATHATYGQNTIIQISADVDGNYTLNVNGSIYDVSVKNGIGSYTLKLDAGTYYANITFNNKNYTTKYKNTQFQVKKATNKVNINVSDVMYGYHSLIEVTADIDGIYTININGTKYNITVNKGFGSKSILLDVGTYKTKTTYNNKNYNNQIKETTFKVTKVDFNYVFIFVENTTYGTPFTIYLVSPVNGQYKVKINDKEINITVIDYFGIYEVDLMDAGTYNISTSCAGDKHFNPTKTSEIFTIYKANNTATIKTKNVTYGENTKLEITADIDGTYTIDINGSTYNITVKNGKATYTLKLDVGTYYANITFNNKNYNTQYKNTKFQVKAALIINAPDVIKYYNGSERFIVTVTNGEGKALANKKVNITINGITYTRNTSTNGSASIAIRLCSGTYNIKVNVDNQTVNSTVTVLTTVNGTNLTKVFRNGTQYYATFCDSQGNYLKEGTTVKFNIHGVIYERKVTGNKGLAKLNINLKQGEYIITAINLETGESRANKITVIPRIIENNDLTKYYRNASQYTVKIIGDDGKTVGADENVTFNINGVFYTRTTNASGIAKLNINLEPGDYIITAEHNGCFVSNKIKVLPVLTAHDLTKKYGTKDQFTTNLVDGQGKTYVGQSIQFNINGVFYNRVTDNNGQAKLNINLQPGQYIITSSYNGLSIGNKITVTA